MNPNPEEKQEKPEEHKSSGARRYGLFGVSNYPEKAALADSQRQSMARWAGAFIIVIAALIIVLVVVSSNIGGLTVTFDSQGGSSIETQAVPYGGTVAEPGEVVRPGYTLVCWSVTPDGSQPWDFSSDTVSQTLTLYAVWEPSP